MQALILFVILTPPGKGNLNWRTTLIRLAYVHICETFVGLNYVRRHGAWAKQHVSKQLSSVASTSVPASRFLLWVSALSLGDGEWPGDCKLNQPFSPQPALWSCVWAIKALTKTVLNKENEQRGWIDAQTQGEPTVLVENQGLSTHMVASSHLKH